MICENLLLDLMFKVISFPIIPTCQGEKGNGVAQCLEVVGTMSVLWRVKSEHLEDGEGYWACGVRDLRKTKPSPHPPKTLSQTEPLPLILATIIINMIFIEGFGYFSGHIFCIISLHPPKNPMKWHRL